MKNLPKIKPLAKSVASFVVPRLATVHGYDNPLGTVSAASCYSIFLRHLRLLHDLAITGVPETVAELGPGSSQGVGLAALIAGAERYFALDLIDFSDVGQNLLVFDELAAMFRARAAIPSSGVHSLRYPDLQDYSFPDFLALPDGEAFERRVGTIRLDLESRGGRFVKVAAPWNEASVTERASVDWVFSQSVLEHIDDLEGVYRSLALWLKPGAVMSHLIDFGSHRMTADWNGHWALDERMWRLLRGRRPYLLNRSALAEHERYAAENGFRLVSLQRNKRFDGLLADQFAARFRGISDEDARTRMAFVVHRASAFDS